MHKPEASRRGVLKAAAGAGIAGALGLPASAGVSPVRIDRQHLLTPDQAWTWAGFKAQGGPTYAGSAGWKRYTDFLMAKAGRNSAPSIWITSTSLTTTTSSTTGPTGAPTCTIRALRSKSSSPTARRCRWSPPTA